jgi:uncharacterized protein (TIGR02444 family)
LARRAGEQFRDEDAMSGNAGAPSPFWTFSLRYYAMTGVPAACLVLQDGSGVDVNVLLFSLFAAKSGRQIESADARRLIDALAEWKDAVVVPLRHARRALKDAPGVIDRAGAEALRNRVKAVELEAERLEQEALFARFAVDGLGAAATPVSAATANIAAYAKALGVSFDTDAVATMITAFNALEDKNT